MPSCIVGELVYDRGYILMYLVTVSFGRNTNCFVNPFVYVGVDAIATFQLILSLLVMIFMLVISQFIADPFAIIALTRTGVNRSI
jgi:hypothetical protein